MGLRGGDSGCNYQSRNSSTTGQLEQAASFRLNPERTDRCNFEYGPPCHARSSPRQPSHSSFSRSTRSRHRSQPPARSQLHTNCSYRHDIFSNSLPQASWVPQETLLSEQATPSAGSGTRSPLGNVTSATASRSTSVQLATHQEERYQLKYSKKKGKQPAISPNSRASRGPAILQLRRAEHCTHQPAPTSQEQYNSRPPSEQRQASNSSEVMGPTSFDDCNGRTAPLPTPESGRNINSPDITHTRVALQSASEDLHYCMETGTWTHNNVAPNAGGHLLSKSRRIAFDKAQLRACLGLTLATRPRPSYTAKVSRPEPGHAFPGGSAERGMYRQVQAQGGTQQPSKLDRIAATVLRFKVLIISRVQPGGGHLVQAARLFSVLQSHAKVLWLRRVCFGKVVRCPPHIGELAQWIEEKMRSCRPSHRVVVLIDDVSAWGQSVAMHLTRRAPVLSRWPNLHVVFYSQSTFPQVAVDGAEPGQVEQGMCNDDRNTLGAHHIAAPSAVAATEAAESAPSAPLAPEELDTPLPDGSQPDVAQKLAMKLRDIFGGELEHMGRAAGLSFEPDGSLSEGHREAAVSAKLVHVLVVTLMGVMDALAGVDLGAVRRMLNRPSPAPATASWVLVPVAQQPTVTPPLPSVGLSESRQYSHRAQVAWQVSAHDEGWAQVVAEGKKTALVRALLRIAFSERKPGQELEWVYEDLWDLVEANWEGTLAEV